MKLKRKRNASKGYPRPPSPSSSRSSSSRSPSPPRKRPRRFEREPSPSPEEDEEWVGSDEGSEDGEIEEEPDSEEAVEVKEMVLNALVQDYMERKLVEFVDGLQAEAEARELKGEIGEHEEEEGTPLKKRIMEIPDETLNKKSKRKILQIIKHAETADCAEASKYANYIDTLSRIPFGKYVDPPLPETPTEVAEATNAFYRAIDATIYGQNDAKNKLTQIFHNGLTVPGRSPQVIGLCGPPGIGKTTLIKEGLAKSQGRPFAFYSLGGAKDSSNLIGEIFAYIGSSCGSIVGALIQTGCMNPVIFFDELCKISDTPQGREIAGVLTHLIDPSQNSSFHDRYFEGIDFDLSRALFVFSYNDRSQVDPILMDRITEVKMDGYSTNDKMEIAKRFIIPEMAQGVGIEETDVFFSDEVLTYIIGLSDEKGVRSLRKTVETIFLKLNILRFPGVIPEIMGESYIPDIVLPLALTVPMVETLLKGSGKRREPPNMMYL